MDRRLTWRIHAPSPLPVFQALHLLLFILLPLALTLRAALHRNGDVLTESTSALYFCLGIAKSVLLVIPLMRISLLILHAGAANVSLSAAWVCVLALALFIGLFISSLRDVATGLSGLFGVRPSTIEKKAPLSRSRTLLMLLGVVLGMMLALTLSLSEWAHFIKALIWPPPRSISVLIQDARVWNNFLPHPTDHRVSACVAAMEGHLEPQRVRLGRGDALDSLHPCVMKPTAQPIDPTKRTEVKPERIQTREEASLVLRIFLLLLLLPFLFELGRLVTKSNALTTSARSLMQRVLTWTLKEGSPQAHLGQEGWLFDQRELNWLLRARDGTEPARSFSITKVAETLKKKNISLVLVAVPQRATLYPEKLHLRNYWDPVRSNGEKARLDALRKSGINVLDATDALWKLRDRKLIYFRRDSHWTPDAMKQVALLTEKHLREKHAALFGSETPLITATAPSHLDAGDLTRKLDTQLPPMHSLVWSRQMCSPSAASAWMKNLPSCCWERSMRLSMRSGLRWR